MQAILFVVYLAIAYIPSFFLGKIVFLISDKLFLAVACNTALFAILMALWFIVRLPKRKNK